MEFVVDGLGSTLTGGDGGSKRGEGGGGDPVYSKLISPAKRPEVFAGVSAVARKKQGYIDTYT